MAQPRGSSGVRRVATWSRASSEMATWDGTPRVQLATPRSHVGPRGGESWSRASSDVGGPTTIEPVSRPATQLPDNSPRNEVAGSAVEEPPRMQRATPRRRWGLNRRKRGIGSPAAGNQ